MRAIYHYAHEQECSTSRLHVKIIALVPFCTAPSGAPCHNPECHLRARLDKSEANSERVMLFGPPGLRPGPTELALGAIESQCEELKRRANAIPQNLKVQSSGGR